MGYKVKRIYVGNNLVRPIYNREPGVNTLAYRPLTSSTTTADQSGNSHTLSKSGSVAFDIYSGVNCASFSGGYLYIPYTSATFLPTGGGSRTVCLWCKPTSTTSGKYIFRYGGEDSNSAFGMRLYATNSVLYYNINRSAYNSGTTTNTEPSGDRDFLALTYETGYFRAYVNGVRTNNISATLSTSANTVWYIGECSNGLTNNFIGYMSEVIVENRAWTADEILDHYNWSKGNYGK